MQEREKPLNRILKEKKKKNVHINWLHANGFKKGMNAFGHSQFVLLLARTVFENRKTASCFLRGLIEGAINAKGLSSRKRRKNSKKSSLVFIKGSV
jgi:hypothetical protein